MSSGQPTSAGCLKHRTLRGHGLLLERVEVLAAGVVKARQPRGALAVLARRSLRWRVQGERVRVDVELGGEPRDARRRRLVELGWHGSQPADRGSATALASRAAGWQYSIGVRMIKTVAAVVAAIPDDAWQRIDPQRLRIRRPLMAPMSSSR